MKIEIDKEAARISISDSLRSQYLMLKAMMWLNLINSVINLYLSRSEVFGTLEIVWTVLGIISVVLLYYFNKKKSSVNSIRLDEIAGLGEKKIMDRSKYCILLKNGRKRDLPEIHNKKDIDMIKGLFRDIRIKTIQL